MIVTDFVLVPPELVAVQVKVAPFVSSFCTTVSQPVFVRMGSSGSVTVHESVTSFLCHPAAFAADERCAVISGGAVSTAGASADERQNTDVPSSSPLPGVPPSLASFTSRNPMEELIARFLAAARSIILSPIEHALLRAPLSVRLVPPAEQVIRASAASLKLTPQEKEEGREALFAFMRARPFTQPQRTSAAPLRRLTAAALASTLTVTLIGGTAAYAAEGSLPGDFLYPVKIHVLEPLVAGLSLTKKKRADWDVRTIERRLEEANDLEKEPPSSEQRAILTTQMDRDIRSLQKHLGALPAEEDRETVRKEVLSGLSEHESALARLRSTIGLPDSLKVLVRNAAREEIERSQEDRPSPAPPVVSTLAAPPKQPQRPDRSRVPSSSSSSSSSSSAQMPARPTRTEDEEEELTITRRARSLLRIVAPESPLLNGEDAPRSPAEELPVHPDAEQELPKALYE